jgi:glutathione synthase/RimK-type ligase-like ATP-grasp enzyme
VASTSFRRRVAKRYYRNQGSAERRSVLGEVVSFGITRAVDWRVNRRVPAFPTEGVVPLEQASHVMLVRSRSPWHFSPQTYAQESAFAHALTDRGREFAVTDQPDRIFEKSVIWFLPDFLVAPRLWDYSRQTREFVAGLERQGNRVLCSSDETAYWENKAHMHRRLDEIGASTPATVILTRENWESAPFEFEPVLIKQEHSAGSAGIHHFAEAREAREFVAGYPFRPTESLIMQEVVRGATRDLRLTIVGNSQIDSATYWRTKSREALSAAEWTTTATTYDSLVEHGNIPGSALPFVAGHLRALGVRTAGVDLMWADDDVTRDPLILEFSPYYQPNPPKPPRYEALTYKQFKTAWDAEDGYLAQQYHAFREIADQILDQELF